MSPAPETTLNHPLGLADTCTTTFRNAGMACGLTWYKRKRVLAHRICSNAAEGSVWHLEVHINASVCCYRGKLLGTYHLRLKLFYDVVRTVSMSTACTHAASHAAPCKISPATYQTCNIHVCTRHVNAKSNVSSISHYLVSL